jgi:hypothetical protein
MLRAIASKFVLAAQIVFSKFNSIIFASFIQTITLEIVPKMAENRQLVLFLDNCSIIITRDFLKSFVVSIRSSFFQHSSHVSTQSNRIYLEVSQKKAEIVDIIQKVISLQNRCHRGATSEYQLLSRSRNSIICQDITNISNNFI